MKANKTWTPEEALMEALEAVDNEGNWIGSKKEVPMYMIEIVNPTAHWTDIKEKAVELLDDFHGEDHYHVTTNWTFPTDDVVTNLTGEVTTNSETGEYFERLCQSEKGNQLESMADKVDQWGRNNRTIAQVFQVDSDLNAMYPPCLVGLQVLYREGQINLFSHFRSHTVAKSYYGDITALGRLMQWLADRVGADVGSLYVLSASLHTRKDNDEYEFVEEMIKKLPEVPDRRANET